MLVLDWRPVLPAMSKGNRGNSKGNQTAMSMTARGYIPGTMPRATIIAPFPTCEDDKFQCSWEVNFVDEGRGFQGQGWRLKYLNAGCLTHKGVAFYRYGGLR